MRSLVRSASIGTSVLSSTIVVAATLSSSVATLLLSSVGLVARESTWVCSGGNDGWDARAADIVGNHVGLRRKGRCCYRVEHTFISAIDEAEEEGQAAGISLALSSAKSSSGWRLLV